MKSCPTCNRTFEDTFTFCLIDGSVLSAPFDPEAAKSASAARDTNPPQTEVLTSGGPSQPLPPTRAASPENLSPTITSPFQPQPIGQPYQTPAVLESADATTKLPHIVRFMFIVRGVVAILFGLLLLLWRVT